jgi:hypothetical protein
MKRLLPPVTVGVALLAGLSGCWGSGASAPLTPTNYIAMAKQSSQGESWGLGVFAKGVGTAKCVIRGGGPPPGILVPGTCTTSVRLHGSDEATVRFVERWNARDFFADSPRRRNLSHTWEITVSRQAAGDHVVGSRHYGDPPPQLIR